MLNLKRVSDLMIMVLRCTVCYKAIYKATLRFYTNDIVSTVFQQTVSSSSSSSNASKSVLTVLLGKVFSLIRLLFLCANRSICSTFMVANLPKLSQLQLRVRLFCIVAILNYTGDDFQVRFYNLFLNCFPSIRPSRAP